MQPIEEREEPKRQSQREQALVRDRDHRRWDQRVDRAEKAEVATKRSGNQQN